MIKITQNSIPPIYVVAGPTGVGKSQFALDLAKKLNGVIINADSRQVYRELNIGTAKPFHDPIRSNRIKQNIFKARLLQNVEHYLYGYVPVSHEYSLYNFQQDVFKLLKFLKKPVVLVGGTGLYIDAVVFQYKLKPSSISREFRTKLSKLSVIELQQKISSTILKKLNNSDRNNPRRLIRIIERSGFISTDRTPPIAQKYIVISPSTNYRQRITTRVEQMFSQGLLEENKILRELGFTPQNSKSLQTIGYQEFENYFKGKANLEDVKQMIIKNTLAYAKRQRTWFKRHEKLKIFQKIQVSRNF